MTEILPEQKIRLLSLDAFRGLTVAGMILVNNPGDWGHIYQPFEHAEWNGCTLADLIFPFFLFISGVSISYALGSKRNDIAHHAELINKIIKRSFILFALGIILAFIPYIFQDPVEAFKTFRVPGILQRIALVYLVSAILFIKTGWKTQVIVAVSLLVIYWILMTLVPVPGVGEPNLGKDTNLGAWLDRLLLTENHLWKLSRTWDPEGILGTLPSIATGISGVLTGTWLKYSGNSDSIKIRGMLLFGVFFLIAGLMWDFYFPINKSLWTSSYVLFTTGLALIIFSSFYWLIDVKRYKSGAIPLVAYGANAITAFFMSTLMAKLLNTVKMRLNDGTDTNLKGWIYESFFSPNLTPYNSSIAFALSFVIFWWIILWVMYTRKIIIKI